MTDRPEFEELVGNDLPVQEEGRLRRIHDLMVQVGPPPELSPGLVRAPDPTARANESNVVGLPPRGRGRLLALVAAVAVIALVIGFVGGRRDDSFNAQGEIIMHGTAAAPTASAEVEVGSLDEAGNWPLQVEAKGLKELPDGGWYELYLTRHGRVGPSCGTFAVHSGTTTVRLNAPYDFRHYDGWIVSEHVPGKKRATRVLEFTGDVV